jgi:hypothetical protein
MSFASEFYWFNYGQQKRSGWTTIELIDIQPVKDWKLGIFSGKLAGIGFG